MTTEKAEPDTLLPCPFCGTEPQIIREADFVSVACPHYYCNFSQIALRREKAAIDRWNTRAAPPRCNAQSEWEPTEAQLNSACLSYNHNFGMMPEDERNMLRFQAREWLRAWQKEGAGADRREIIEECAAIVDQANREGPYQAISAASRIRALTETKPAQGDAE